MTSSLNPAWLAWGSPPSAPSAPFSALSPVSGLSASPRLETLSPQRPPCPVVGTCAPWAQHALGRRKFQRLFDVSFVQLSYAVATKGMSNSLQVSITRGGWWWPGTREHTSVRAGMCGPDDTVLWYIRSRSPDVMYFRESIMKARRVDRAEQVSPNLLPLFLITGESVEQLQYCLVAVEA